MNNEEYKGWKIEKNAAKSYVEAVNKILENEDLFNNFRAGVDGYTRILEHLSYYDGIVYYNTIKQKYPHLFESINRFKINDSVGSPLTYEYPDIGKINPTTLRYIKVAGDIQKEFGELSGMDFVEIGGGYGGLANVVSKLFNFNSIRLLDLPNVLLLQKKYLNKFQIEPLINLSPDNIISENSIVVSNYSWNELDTETREDYLNKIIKKAKYAYITACDPESCGQLFKIEGKKKLEQEPFDGNCTIFTNKKYE